MLIFNCQRCGKEFKRKPSAIKKEACKFCSRACWHGLTLEQRFWIKVKKTRNCWLWTGSTVLDGYGVIHDGKNRGAHRVSWQIHHGPIPNGMCVLHHCDNPPCVRPEHLFLGTKRDNALDSINKGRHIRHWWLTDDDIRTIRKLHIPYIVTAKMLAKKFRVSDGHISNILCGRTRSKII